MLGEHKPMFHPLMIDQANKRVTLTVSQIQQFQDCQMLEFFHSVMQRKSATTTVGARNLGTLFHAEMEAWLTDDLPGNPWTTAENWALREKMEQEYRVYGLDMPDPRVLNEATVLADRGAWFVRKWLDKKADKYWDEVLAVELPFHIKIAELDEGWEVWLRGKPDVFVLADGEVWHTQWKTYTGPLVALTETVKAGLHENTYPLIAKQWWPDHVYGGTMLGSFSKSPKHRKVKGAPKCECCGKGGMVLRPPEGEVHVQFLPIDELGIQRAVDTIRVIGAAILRQFHFAATWDPSLYPYTPPVEVALQNEHMCTGRWGNMLCPFRRGPCNGDGPVTDNLVYEGYDPLERYIDA